MLTGFGLAVAGLAVAGLLARWLLPRGRADFLAPWAAPECVACEGSGVDPLGFSRTPCVLCRGTGREQP